MSGVGTLVGVGLIFVVNVLLVLKFLLLLFTTFLDPSSSYGFTDFQLGGLFAAFLSSSQHIPISWLFLHFVKCSILPVVGVVVGVGVASFSTIFVSRSIFVLSCAICAPCSAFATAIFAHSYTIELVVFAIALICSESWLLSMISISLFFTSFKFAALSNPWLFFCVLPNCFLA